MMGGGSPVENKSPQAKNLVVGWACSPPLSTSFRNHKTAMIRARAATAVPTKHSKRFQGFQNNDKRIRANEAEYFGGFQKSRFELLHNKPF